MYLCTIYSSVQTRVPGPHRGNQSRGSPRRRALRCGTAAGRKEDSARDCTSSSLTGWKLLTRVVSTLTSTLLEVAAAVATDDLKAVFSISGAAGFCLVCYIAPGILSRRCRRESSNTRLQSYPAYFEWRCMDKRPSYPHLQNRGKTSVLSSSNFCLRPGVI